MAMSKAVSNELERILDDAFGMGKNYPEDYKVLKKGMLKKADEYIARNVLEARVDELQNLALSELGDDTKDNIYYKYIKPRVAELTNHLSKE